MRKDSSIVNKGQAKTLKKVNKYRSVSSDTYNSLLGDISSLLEDARRSASRTVNAVMTATYWLIGRRMVEFE